MAYSSTGWVRNPDYKQVCSDGTGRAEVVPVTYGPTQMSCAELLETFWGSQDATTRNRQGSDVRTQHRSVSFDHKDEQRRLAEYYMHKLDASGAIAAPIVTEIVPSQQFVPAGSYHQDYSEHRGRQHYWQIVIPPKSEKRKRVFVDKLEAGHRVRAQPAR